ncbi:MAG: helix-hairpin-helix domain-containing protein [Chlorobi bacterium]|nr:helix-hairpin-helix domain-containing protein [Chlorobiota bacterium]
MKKTGIIILYLGFLTVTNAQQQGDLKQVIAEMLEPLAEKQLIQQDYSELLDDLIFLYDHPLDINKVTKENLERIPFLTDYQIENILFYLYNNGPMLTIYELNAIEDLPPETIKLITPFLKIYPESPRLGSPKFSYADALGRVRSLLQTPTGYFPANDSTPPVFSGSKQRIFLRLNANLNNTILTGFTMEKDPGEPSFTNGIPVMDFMSGYIMFKPNKILKKFIAGDFKASFGQGLGLWTGLAFSKNSNVIDIRRRGKGLEKYSSLNENSYLRGIAAEFNIKSFSFNLFGSYKKIDGTLSGAETISAIRDNGYHRTATELLYRNNITETVAGGIASWKSNTLRIDAGQTFWKIDKILTTDETLYRLLNFTGDSLYTTFAGYNWFGKKLILFGEIAIQNFTTPALYQGLTFSPGADIQLAMNYRYYGNSYFSIHSNPFSASSAPAGERGFYAGISFIPFKNAKVNAYFDFFSFNRLRYNIDKPSSGSDILIQAGYNFNKNISLYGRFRSLHNEHNVLNYTGNDFPVTNRKTNSFRLWFKYDISHEWWIRQRFEQLFFNEKGGLRSDGFLICSDAGYSFKDKISANIRIAHFDTDDYYSRIYIYEPDVHYSFYIPSYAGNGLRFILNVSVKPVEKLQFWFRIANTSYSSTDKTGSGYNTVEGNNLTEIKLQLKYRFK